jgi:hypothetical protein
MRRALVICTVGVTAAAAYVGVGAGTLGDGVNDLATAAHSVVAGQPAAADELPRFERCADLRAWYLRTALPQVGPWGLAGPPVLFPHPTPLMRQLAVVGTPDSSAAGRTGSQAGSQAGSQGSQADDGVGASATGTNVQDAGVDESDVAKTDGRLLARVTGRTLVLTDVSGRRPRELSRTTLTGAAVVHAELVLRGSRVLVVGQQASVSRGGPVLLGPDGGVASDLAGDFRPPVISDPHTRLVSFDVSNPSAPRLTDDRTLDGSAVSTREYADGTVRVVLSTGYPSLGFVHPGVGRTAAEATGENRRILAAAPLSSWLPQVVTGAGDRTPLLDCSDVRHPLQPSGLGTVSVLSFPIDDAADYRATAVTTSGDLVYSSTDRLYVATPNGDSTTVHAFALDGLRTRYVGSGTVPGVVKDRWSLDEYDGHLRVASTVDSWRSVTDTPTRPGLAGTPAPPDRVRAGSTTVTVLAERNGRLVATGRVGGLGRGEELEAVRWLGTLALVVTFRSTDPLYTLDLADPVHPRVAGELSARGYSSYLHPVGGGLVVGIGHDATSNGADLGTRAATFDLRDPGHVRRTGTLALGRDSDVAAGVDARTFSYLPTRRVLVTPVQSWATGTSRFVALHVGTDGRLSGTGSWPGRGFLGTDVRALPLGGDRVALVDDGVRLVHVG